jgi:hypothetical protein
MSTRWAVCAASAALAFIAFGSACAESRTVHIRVEGDSQFEVLYHRAKSNATGAALGGLLGAGIQASIESEMDSKKREELSPHISSALWKDSFLPALEKALLAKDHTITWVDSKHPMKTGADLYLIIYPRTHGYRMVDTSTYAVSPYVDLTFGYAFDAGKSSRPTKENFYLAGKEQSTYENIVADAATANARLEQLHMQAAQRLANKIIYNVKQ